MTTALYRRYRPESFAEVIGQDHVTAPLRQALRSGQANHAYLFSGPRGCGKTTSARILARCLNCAEGPTDTPCGVCPSCVELARGGPGSLDVVEIDAASHGGVDDARELRERATFAPARDRYKVFILDEAHMVSPQGFNALLKIVEEPPPHVKFIFATTEPDKVIGTIRSRTHHYPFRLVPPDVLVPYLEQLCTTEGVPVGAGVLSLVVRAGGGSVRDTLSVLDQLIAGSGPDGLDYEGAVALLGYTHTSLLDDLVDALAARDGASAFRVVERVIATGHEPRRFVEDLLERLRDLIVIAASGEAAAAVLRDVPADQLDRMRRQATHLGPSELSRSADLANAALTEMVGATSPRLHLELLMARLLLPSADDSTTGLGARVDRLERGLPAVPGGAGSSAPGASVPVASVPAAAAQARPSAAPSAGPPPVPAAAPVRPGAAPTGAPTDPPSTTPDGSVDARAAADDAPAGRGPERAPATDAAPTDQGPDTARTDQGPDTARTDTARTGTAPTDQAPDAAVTPATRRAEGAEPGASTASPSDGATPPHDAAQHAAPRTSARDERVRDAAASWDAAPSGVASSEATPTGAATPPPARPAASPGPQPAAAPAPVAPVAAPAAAAPAAAAPTAPGAAAAAADTEMLRRRWPDVLTTLRRLRLPSWALVNQHAQILELDATTLRLGFAQPGLVTTFRNSNHGDVVARALAETLGVTARVEAVLDEPGGGSGGSGGHGPANPGAPTPQVPDVISPERAAASWGDPVPATSGAGTPDPARDAGAADAATTQGGGHAPTSTATSAGDAERPAGRSAAPAAPAADRVPTTSGREGSDPVEAAPADGTSGPTTDHHDDAPGVGAVDPGAGAAASGRPVPPWEPDPATDDAAATGPSAAPRRGDAPAGAGTRGTEASTTGTSSTGTSSTGMSSTGTSTDPQARPAPGAEGGASSGAAPVVAHHDDDIPPGDEPDDPWRDGPPRPAAPRSDGPAPHRTAPAGALSGRGAPGSARADASGPAEPVAPSAPPVGPGATARERGAAAARAAAAQSRSRRQEPDEPSPDDPTIGQSGLVGVQLVAQVLGGRVIEEQIEA